MFSFAHSGGWRVFQSLPPPTLREEKHCFHRFEEIEKSQDPGPPISGFPGNEKRCFPSRIVGVGVSSSRYPPTLREEKHRFHRFEEIEKSQNPGRRFPGSRETENDVFLLSVIDLPYVPYVILMLF